LVFAVLFADHLKAQGVDRDLSRIMAILADRSRAVQKAFFSHSGVAQTKNIHGEQQMELDTYADSVFLRAMEKSLLVRTVASEEQDDIVEIVKAKGSYGVTLDPLDGSSLIKTNLAVGTIAGFFNEGDVMERGSRMDAAMYILYGPITSLIYTAKNGVHEFVMSSSGKFKLRRENITMPDGKIYCPGGLRAEWPERHKGFINDLEKQGYKLRFSGGFVPDFQQILSYGGIFTYPALYNAPSGKFRLVFEANPMALIAEQAGGEGTNGIGKLHDLKPESLSQRTPLYVGGKKEIELAKKYLSGN